MAALAVCSISLLLFLSKPAVGFGASTTVLLVGAGNCDVSDHACKQLPDPAEHKVAILNPKHLSDGVMSTVAVGGLPSWVAAGKPTTGCAYATLTDLNNVVSLRVSKNFSAAVVANVSLAAQGLVNPVHLAVDPAAGTMMTAAFYHGPDDAAESPGAGVVLFSVSPDTCEIKVGAFVRTSGHSTNPARQGTSHVHSTTWDLSAKAPSPRIFACVRYVLILQR